MKSKDLIAQAKERNVQAMVAAMKSGDEEQMMAATAVFCSDIHDAVMHEANDMMRELGIDFAAMSARGAYQLTSDERNYYTALAEAMKSNNPQMAITNIQVALPLTIIDSVIDDIRKQHPLLDKIRFVNTTALTKFVVNNKPAQMAKWGKLCSEIDKELSGAIEELNMTLLKLTAFFPMCNDMLDLGPVWLDRYVRAVLSEAVALALETAIVSGTGKDEPIGMDRDISDEASVQGGAYPQKSAIALADLTPKSWGAIVSKIAADPADATQARAITGMILIVNPFDYWGKWNAALSFQKPDGGWVRDALPIPAEIIQSNGVAKGKAILGMPDRYFAGLGATGKGGNISFSDEYHFLEDERVYKAKFQGNARPMDNNAFQLLDISGTDFELAFPVRHVGE